ncbi:MAG: glycosyltransferase family 1 protein [Clostridia bacterium]|nr:glycosyltransferase family 1 protein [Clostridia bacterium]
MKRILHLSGTMNMGGQETLIMNIYRNIDRSEVQFDFVVNTEERCFFEDEIEKLGGKVYRVPRLIHIFKHWKELSKILKENKYDVIHRHTASQVVFIDLLIAKLRNVKTRIIHSHNVSVDKKYQHLYKIFTPLINGLSTTKYACSEDAAKWLYGKRVKDFKVIYNGIDIDKFSYDEEVRKKVRSEFKIQDNIKVYGNVGRMSYQKNHMFLLDVFKNILEKDSNSVLLLCGDGEKREEIEEKAKELNIYEKVIFAGVRKDVNYMYQAMDYFVFPSLFEGLGIVLIEAQVAGLPCFIFDKRIPTISRISNNIHAFDEDADAKYWANVILANNEIKDRKIDKKDFEKFDIKYTTAQVLEDYLK